MKPRPHKPKEGEWFAVSPTFTWRCCECGHAAKIDVQVQMRGAPIEQKPCVWTKLSEGCYRAGCIEGPNWGMRFTEYEPDKFCQFCGKPVAIEDGGKKGKRQ